MGYFITNIYIYILFVSYPTKQFNPNGSINWGPIIKTRKERDSLTCLVITPWSDGKIRNYSNNNKIKLSHISIY